MGKDSTIKILSIETSCDETAAAVISGEITNPKSKILNPKQIQNLKIQNPKIISSIVSSQVDLHAKTGGVVPEVASRAHMEAMIPVIKQALLVESGEWGVGSDNIKHRTPYLPLLTGITHIAVTAGPGLIGSLLVGFNTAKALAYALDLPIIPINHIEGHIYSAIGGENPKSDPPAGGLISNKIPNPNSQITNSGSLQLTADSFPLVALTVSGGHTSLTLVKNHGEYQNLGSTLDDAAGEAFDKVAKLLDLGYPGGPAVSKLAEEFRNKLQITNNKCQIKLQKSNSKNDNEDLCKSVEEICGSTHPIIFPRPIMNDGTFNFSFSGLKTAVLETVRKYSSSATRSFSSLRRPADRTISENIKAEICAAFEDAAVDVLVTKTMRAVSKYKPRGVILAGGVAANRRLRGRLTEELNNLKTQRHLDLNLFIPPIELCGDNAAMIGMAAYYHILKGDVKRWDEISVDSNMKL